MAKIDRVEDLPEWFALKKYQGCENFGAPEWLEQMHRRYELLELHPSRVRLSRPEDSETLQAFWLDFWKMVMLDGAPQVREAPLESPSKGQIKKWMAGADNQPIRAVRALDLLHQSGADLDAERNGKAPLGISARWSVIFQTKISEWKSSAHSYAPLSINHYNGAPEKPILQVDLGASDATLKTAFAAWLKEARAAQKKNTARRTKPLYERWARYGLLPYLDLLIWSMETDTHIPDRVMSAAISSYDAGEANLRKTVAPLAAALMRDLSELQGLAAVGAAAKTQESPEASED